MLSYADSNISLERYHYIENLLNTEIIDSVTESLSGFSCIPYFYIKQSSLCFSARSIEFAVVNEGLDSWVNPNVLHELFSIKADIICDSQEDAKQLQSEFNVPGFHSLALIDGHKVSLIVSINTRQDLFGASLLRDLDSFFAQCFDIDISL
ncbi:MAG: hypothetical protein ACTJIB_12730 [Pseudoalteromonas prydzensis]|uniref:hypothetical protein n=1 Tax=Pseudoalteromonas prydzensis TaxID=182141 RepID=UPI003F965962